MGLDAIVEEKIKLANRQAEIGVLSGLGQAMANLSKTGIDMVAFASIRKKLQALIIECEHEFKEVELGGR